MNRTLITHPIPLPATAPSHLTLHVVAFGQLQIIVDKLNLFQGTMKQLFFETNS